MKKIGIIVGVIVAVAVFVGVGWAFSNSSQAPVEAFPSYTEVREMAEAIDTSDYDVNSVIPANAESGWLAENIEGDLAKAKVVIYEYADYQCTYCSYFNPTVNSILAAYGDDVAVVFRTYLLEYHNNGVQAALAAEAAGKQGYWQEFKDVLFDNQDDWYYSNRNKFQRQIEEYFAEATGGAGDYAQLVEDMRDEDILQKIAFSMALGIKIDLPGTPSFYVNGEKVDINSLYEKVGELIGA